MSEEKRYGAAPEVVTTRHSDPGMSLAEVLEMWDETEITGQLAREVVSLRAELAKSQELLTATQLQSESRGVALAKVMGLLSEVAEALGCGSLPGLVVTAAKAANALANEATWLRARIAELESTRALVCGWLDFANACDVGRRLERALESARARIAELEARDTAAVEFLREHGKHLANVLEESGLDAGPGEPSPTDLAVRDLRNLLAALGPAPTEKPNWLSEGLRDAKEEAARRGLTVDGTGEYALKPAPTEKPTREATESPRCDGSGFTYYVAMGENEKFACSEGRGCPACRPERLPQCDGSGTIYRECENSPNMYGAPCNDGNGCPACRPTTETER